jgi:hypothetical protein
MKELNRNELLKLTGGGNGPDDTTTPAELDWAYCRGVSYLSNYWFQHTQTTERKNHEKPEQKRTAETNRRRWRPGWHHDSSEIGLDLLPRGFIHQQLLISSNCTTTIRKTMKELNKDQLLKVLGGSDGPGDDTTPAELDWAYCRSIMYSSNY